MKNNIKTIIGTLLGLVPAYHFVSWIYIYNKYDNVLDRIRVFEDSALILKADLAFIFFAIGILYNIDNVTYRRISISILLFLAALNIFQLL